MNENSRNNKEHQRRIHSYRCFGSFCWIKLPTRNRRNNDECFQHSIKYSFSIDSLTDSSIYRSTNSSIFIAWWLSIRNHCDDQKQNRHHSLRWETRVFSSLVLRVLFVYLLFGQSICFCIFSESICWYLNELVSLRQFFITVSNRIDRIMD